MQPYCLFTYCDAISLTGFLFEFVHTLIWERFSRQVADSIWRSCAGSAALLLDLTRWGYFFNSLSLSGTLYAILGSIAYRWSVRYISRGNAFHESQISRRIFKELSSSRRSISGYIHAVRASESNGKSIAMQPMQLDAVALHPNVTS